MQNTTTISTETESTKIIKQGQEIMYKILKRKPVDFEKIMKDLNVNIENRFNDRMKKVLPQVENKKFDNPEKSLRVVMLNVLIKVLTELSEEMLLTLDENDKKLIDEIMTTENSDK